MKKLFCLCLTMALCMLSATAFAAYVPTSTSKLPNMFKAPEAPKIIRVQKAEDSVTITLTEALPENALVFAWLRDADYSHHAFLAKPSEENTYIAIVPVPTSGNEWTDFEIFWRSGDVNAKAHYNAAGGLETVARNDSDYNEYIFDNDGRFCEFAYYKSGVRARFNTRGVMTRYGHEAFRDMIVWFSKTGDVVCAEYDKRDGGIAADWEPGYGWFVDTSEGREKLKLDVPSPWNARRLLKKPETEEDPVEVIHYPNNTICVAGLTLQEASTTLPDKWYNVLPVDLTRDGRQTYYLTISNMFYIGKVYVDVWGDEVTVDCSLLDQSAIRPLSRYGRWFTSLSQITTDSIESSENGFTFGEPVSISEDLGGADVALLFIRSKATYYQPFLDGTTLTRYWRNLTEWKEFRQGLQELMLRVEK